MTIRRGSCPSLAIVGVSMLNTPKPRTPQKKVTFPPNLFDNIPAEEDKHQSRLSIFPAWVLFIHAGYFYSNYSSPLLLRDTPDTARTLCRSFTQERQGQLRVKDLPKAPIDDYEGIRTRYPSVERRRIYQ